METFPRARVQAMGDGVQLALRVARQVRPLGEVLAQQPVRVFIGAALPRAIRIGNEDLDRESRCQALVLGPLVAPIIGQGFAQQRGHMPELVREALTGTPCIRPLHPCQEDQARRPRHQGPDGRAIASPLDQGALPVAGHRAGRDLGGALGQRRHVGDLAASIGPPRPRAACLARLTQRRQQFAAPGSAGQHRQAPIDGLGREVFPHVVRIRALETSGNLLGRAALRQMRPHILPQPGIQEFAGSPWLARPTGCSRVCRARAIQAAPSRVAGALTAHGAGRSPQHPRHHPQRMAMGQAQTQRLTVCVTQVRIACLWHGNTVAPQGL